MNRSASTFRLILFGGALAAGLAAAFPFPAFDVQAHRGGRGLLPENSLPAFGRAIELGVDTLELDLAVTKDGVLVVSHDPLVNATICTAADGREPAPGTAIHSLTLRELKTYDCGAKRNPAFLTQTPVPGTRVPTLQEVFDLVKARGSRVLFNIETKVTPEWERAGITPSPDVFARLLVRAITDNGLENRAVVQSFDFRSLVAVRQLDEKLTTSALFSAAQTEAIANPVAAMAGTGATVFSPAFNRLTEAAIKAAHAAGYKVIPWTVDEEADMRRLIGWGVDGLISDYPDLLVRVARETGKR